MSRLLSANFARLRKSRTFWIEMLFMFGLGILMVISAYRIMSVSDGSELPALDYVFMSYLQVISFACAAFCSLFSGTEYSDGTIRNKLIAGHTRITIYLSNLVVNVTAGILFCMAALLSSLLLGLPLLGGLAADSVTTMQLLLGSMITVVAFCSIFTLISMINQNKSTGVALCMIVAGALFFSSILIMQKLEEPETYTEYLYVDDSDETERRTEDPNPYYPRGLKREIYIFLNDFLPSGQMIQYTQMRVEHPVRLPLYSLGIILVVTAGGIYVFGKKNIK